jgi:predicted RNA binding protein YcfA (HicA-like mRNA interferase family)
MSLACEVRFGTSPVAPVPPKVRELIAELERAGFENRGGRGSHRNYVHPHLSKPITISGKLGDDAKQYQVRAVAHAIAELTK